MARWHLAVLTMTAFLGNAPAARAGPCTAQIAQVERQIAELQAKPAPSGAGEATAPQSLGAQLHHQPTPGSVESALSKANTEAAAALDRARKADAAGDAAGCASILEEAKRLYGIE